MGALAEPASPEERPMRATQCFWIPKIKIAGLVEAYYYASAGCARASFSRPSWLAQVGPHDIATMNVVCEAAPLAHAQSALYCAVPSPHCIALHPRLTLSPPGYCTCKQYFLGCPYGRAEAVVLSCHDERGEHSCPVAT